jgi:hypothetical protein
VADLAGAHLLVEHFEGFFQRREHVVGLVLVAQLAEEVGAALRPVQLVQVDAVGLQALEAGIQRGDDVLAVVLELAVADVVDAVAGAGDLAGQHPVVAVAAAFEPVADDAFGGGVGFGRGGTGYISAVSMKLIPAALARSIWAKASSWLFCSPQVMVPRQRALTLRSVRPSWRYSIGCSLAKKHKSRLKFFRNLHNSAPLLQWK